MSKKNVDSILKGVAAAGLALGGGGVAADVVYACELENDITGLDTNEAKQSGSASFSLSESCSEGEDGANLLSDYLSEYQGTSIIGQIEEVSGNYGVLAEDTILGADFASNIKTDNIITQNQLG